MNKLRVLVVEDDAIIAMNVEQSLIDAGYEVCGVASSEASAIAMSRDSKPQFAIVDIGLDPGDGRAVAEALCRDNQTIVLYASGQCEEVRLHGHGAIGCLPKPYKASDVPKALWAISRIVHGQDPGRLPDHLIAPLGDSRKS